MTENISPPISGSSDVKRKNHDLSDSESDDDHGHLQEITCPTEGSSSGSGGARPKNTLKPCTTSMTDNISPPISGSSCVKRKSDDLSDSESDDDLGHLQEDMECDSDSSDFAPSAATCAICLGKMRGAVGSPNVCEHTFCIECIIEWSNNNATCPQDRKSFNLILVRDNLGGNITSELPVDLRPEQPAEALQENTTYCEVCNASDREDCMLLCDGCDMGYHLECLTPPLSTVPIEEWFCPACIAANLPQSGLGSISEQHSSTEAGPSSSSSGSQRFRSSQSDARSSHTRERITTRPRLIPRTQATERVRKKIFSKKKTKRAERRKKKAEKKKKVVAMEHENKLHCWGKDSMGADVDALYNSDDDAQKILDGNALQKRISSFHARERQEEKRANAAKIIREGFFTPHTSYAGPKTSVVTRVALAPRPSASADILGHIFESQSISFTASKDLALTGDRKLQPKDPKKFEEGSFAKDIHLPSQKSSISKESNHSPSRSSKSKYNLSPRSSKESPPRYSRRNPTPKHSKHIPSPRSSKYSSSPKSARLSPSNSKYKCTTSLRGYKNISPFPRIHRSSQDYKHEYSSRIDRPWDDKYYSPLELRNRSPPKMSYDRPVSSRREWDNNRIDRSQDDKYYSPLESRNRSPPKLSYGRPVFSRREWDRKLGYSSDERGYKQEQQSLNSVGNLMAQKNKKKESDKGKHPKTESRKEKSSESKRKKLSSQRRESEIDSDSCRKESNKHKINKLKIVPRPLKCKNSIKNTENKRKKHNKHKRECLSNSSSSNSSDSSDTEEEFGSKSDKEKIKAKLKNIEIQKAKDKTKDDLEGSASIGEQKININLKYNFSLKINKKNALGVDDSLPDKEAKEDKYTYYNPYEKKRISHLTPQEEKEKLLKVDEKSASSLYERTTLVLAATKEEKCKEKSIKSSDKCKNVPTIPLPDKKHVREEVNRNDVIKDLPEKNYIIKDALMQGSETQRDVITDAIKDVIGSNTEKASIRERSDIIKYTVIGANDVKNSSQTLHKIKGISTISLPADKPKKNQENNDELEEVGRKAVSGSSQRRSRKIKLNLLSDKARNNDKSKGQTGMKDYDIIGLQVTKKKEESQVLQNKIKKLFYDEDMNKNKNAIKKISKTNQDKSLSKIENKEKEKSQSHRDSSNEIDDKHPKGTSKKDTSNLYTEKKSDIRGLDLISTKKRDSMDTELPAERKITFSRNFGDDSDLDFTQSSFKYTRSYGDNNLNISKVMDCEVEKKTKENEDLIKHQKREMEKERKVAECIKAFHRHKGILESKDEQEDKDSIDDIVLDTKTQKKMEDKQKCPSSTHGLVDNFVLQNNPDLKANSEDEDKPYSPTQSANLEDSDPVEDDITYSPTQNVPDEVMSVPKPSSAERQNKNMQNPVSSHDINKSLLESKVIEEVKKYLDPYYRDKTFNREQYKQIVSKCVNKVLNVECGYVIKSFKMHKLVDGYVKLFKHRMKKERMLKLYSTQHLVQS